jgi:hypothetical protein
MKLTLPVAALAVLALVGCAGNAQDPAPETASSEGKLEISISDAKVAGTWTLGEDKVVFESVAAGDVYEISFKLHGLMLDSTIDKASGVASMDGFALENGGDTQVLDADRATMLKFVKALDGLPSNAPTTATLMRRTASNWSQTSESLKLDRRIMGEEGRGWTSLCGYMGQVYNATHDGWSHSRWDSDSSVHSYVGYYTGPTYYWRGYWSESSYDHANWPYEYGQCFGRCGAGCGSETDYTVDCHDHDSCVRNGHSIASLWCDDEFVSASDDELFASSCNRH